MGFDIEGARKAGYSETEIADYMGSQNNFDVGGARRSGYADNEIITHLSGPATPPQPETSWIQNTAIGIGKGMTDVGTGALQRVLEGGEAIRSAVGMESNQPNIDRLKAITAENRQAFAPLKESSTAANVGEFVGQVAPTVMIPGGVAGGALKRAGTSALSGAATGFIQPTTEGESPLQNAAVGGAFGAGASGVLSGVGKVGNALFSRLPPNLREALAKRYKIRTTLGEATDKPITQTAETWLEKIPVIGLRGFREKQRVEADAAAHSLLAHYVSDPAAIDAMKANRAFAGSLYETLKREVAGIGDQNIPPNQTRQAAIEVLDRYPDLFKKFQDTKRERLLKNIMSDTADPTQTIKTRNGNYLSPDEWETVSTPATMTFKDAWMLRDSLGEMIGQAKKTLAGGGIDKTQLGEISRLYSAVNNDIDSWAASVGRGDVRTMITEANEAYKQYVVKYDILQRAYDKAISLTGESEKFSPQKFSTALYKIVDSDKAYHRFSPTEIDELTGIANIMGVVKRAGQFKENPATGNRYGLPVVAAAGGAIGTMKLLPYVAVVRMLTGTEAGKKLAMAASKIEPDNKNMKIIMKMVYNQLPKMAATGATEE